jgi:predicted enzyme related to lactoylglutathione lyase
MDHTIVHFELPADDPERAAKFYRELFGWDIQRWAGSADTREGFEYWTVRTVPAGENGMPQGPGVNGGLMRRMYPGQPLVNYINVEDVEDYTRRAQRLGAKVMMEKQPVPGMGWFAQLTDPEGNLFAVWQTDPQARAIQKEKVGNAGR